MACVTSPPSLSNFEALTCVQSDGSMTRYRFFTYVFVGAGLWYLLPDFLFTAVGWFSWACWIAPGVFACSSA